MNIRLREKILAPFETEIEQQVYTEEIPGLPGSPAQLEDYLEHYEASRSLRPDNEARIIWHNATARKTKYSFLYLHGFAGSYRDGYPLNVKLAEHFGGNIYLSRMAGHGKTADSSMINFTPEKVWEKACRDLAIARQLGEKTIIISTSTGGTLALKLAATFPDEVWGLINISPNIEDGQLGSSLLNTPWGDEISYLIFTGDHRKIEHPEPLAEQYWDTIYPVISLRNLQQLVETTMVPETFQKISCPVLTLYYYENYIEKDWRVDVEEFPKVHEELGTPDDRHHLQKLRTPKAHFIGSDIKSKDWLSGLDAATAFCEKVMHMEPVYPAN